MSQSDEPNGPQIDVGDPRFFTLKAFLIQGGFQFLGLVPMLIVVLLCDPALAWLKDSPLAGVVVIFLLLQLALAAIIFFLPLQLGNSHVTKLVRLFEPSVAVNRRRFVVQAEFVPRIRKGFRASVDNADDIGILRFQDQYLLFEGDSITVKLPLQHISQIRLHSAGWRGFWLLQCVTISLRNFPGPTTAIKIVERSSWSIRKSRQIMQELYQLLELHWRRRDWS